MNEFRLPYVTIGYINGMTFNDLHELVHQRLVNIDELTNHDLNLMNADNGPPGAYAPPGGVSTAAQCASLNARAHAIGQSYERICDTLFLPPYMMKMEMERCIAATAESPHGHHALKLRELQALAHELLVILEDAQEIDGTLRDSIAPGRLIV